MDGLNDDIVRSRFLSSYVLEAPDPQARFERFVRLGAGLFLAVGILGSMAVILPGNSIVANPRAIAALCVGSLIVGSGMLAVSRYISPLHLALIYFAGITMTSAGIYFAGQRGTGFVAMVYAWQTSLGFILLRRRWLIIAVTTIGVEFAFITIVAAADIYQAMNAWVFTMGTVVVTGAFVSLLVQDLHRAIAAETSARAETEATRAELANMNKELEARVETKVREVENLSFLRRFVSSNVADALIGSDKALDPHRREIAVFFIDLRGFTSFAMNCDPEEVIQVLDQFYAVLGRGFNEHGATVGAFQADGVMAYFNDPVTIDDPAHKAVAMALDLSKEMEVLVESWVRKGFDLNFGIGVALGFATMGMVGFDGREDYTAIGTVVNLAARLCSESLTGEVLIDRKVRLALDDTVSVEELEPRRLKGFPDPVPVFRVLG